MTAQHLVHCFASLNETDEERKWLGLDDYLCLLEDGHSGEHVWTHQSEIMLSFAPFRRPQ